MTRSEALYINQMLAVAVGAVGGAWLRWGLSVSLNPLLVQLPMGTLLANLLGGFLMGGVLAWSQAGTLSPELKLLIATGFLGGLTTFSTFSAESFQLLGKGQYAWGMAHLASHVLGSVSMTALGFISYNWLKNG